MIMKPSRPAQPSRSLVVSRSTLRVLSSDQLARAIGGVGQGPEAGVVAQRTRTSHNCGTRGTTVD
jgi:hypothetical protein